MLNLTMATAALDGAPGPAGTLKAPIRGQMYGPADATGAFLNL
jgi:hypothetical protein